MTGSHGQEHSRTFKSQYSLEKPAHLYQEGSERGETEFRKGEGGVLELGKKFVVDFVHPQHTPSRAGGSMRYSAAAGGTRQS